jgi:hypothetical protein
MQRPRECYLLNCRSNIRVENCALYERALHRVLTIWNRWIDDAPGSEWFKTSKTEILSIVQFLNNPPEGADVK